MSAMLRSELVWKPGKCLHGFDRRRTVWIVAYMEPDSPSGGAGHKSLYANAL
jgi:hypothetical protein